jgi:hypothetical protein
MPGIQITVSPALMGSSDLVQIISVETVPYTLAYLATSWSRTPLL